MFTVVGLTDRRDDMENLLEGAYDLHIHCGPDVIPRSITALEMAHRAEARKMRGFVIKSHYAPTCLQAVTVRACCPGCNAVGSITLNASVGGLNPLAVETAARMGAKVVWCPTFDSASQQSYYLRELPQYIGIQKKLIDRGERVPSYQLLDESGGLVHEMQVILDLVQEYNMALGTGHITHAETFALAREAKKRGYKKLIVTHADWEFTHYSQSKQQSLAEMGAFIEHSYTSPAEKHIPWSQVFSEIRKVGVSHCFISTDLGKVRGCFPDDGLEEYAERLVAAGFGKRDLHNLLVENPAFLVE